MSFTPFTFSTDDHFVRTILKLIMRFFAILAFAGAVSASILARQAPPGMYSVCTLNQHVKLSFSFYFRSPACALTCMASADTGSCQSDDNGCLCRDSAFVNSVTECVESSCTGSDLTNALAFAQENCAAVGVTLTSTPTPTPTSPTSSSGSTATTTQSSSSSSSSGSPSYVSILTHCVIRV